MNDDRLRKCFAETLGVPLENVGEELHYNRVKQWDSVGHMSLITALEAEFGVMLDTDDILAMNSFAVAREILAKHSITFP